MAFRHCLHGNKQRRADAAAVAAAAAAVGGKQLAGPAGSPLLPCIRRHSQQVART